MFWNGYSRLRSHWKVRTDMKKALEKGLKEAEVKAKKCENDYIRGVLDCMSTEELRELVAMYDNDNIDEQRHNEIWERAENEYKCTVVKKNPNC